MGLERIIKMADKTGLEEWNKVVVYGDRHTSIYDKSCDKILKTYLSKHSKSITEIVDIGDGVDNPFMSDFPVDPDFVKSAQDEIDEYAKHLKDLDRLVPKAKKIIIPGNHDKNRFTSKKNMNRGVASLRNMQYENVLKEALNKYGVNIKNFILANTNYVIKHSKNQESLFTHGDPRLDHNIKGGVTSARRTADSYPFKGDIYMGHSHWFKIHPRMFEGKHLVTLGMMANIKNMEEHYLTWHPYDNGFGVIHYNKKRDKRIFQYIPIVDGEAIIDGKLYKG